MAEQPVTIDDIIAARDRLSGAVAHTPLEASRTLSAISGVDLSIKFENLQFTASFKERGARNRLLHLDEVARQRGVIAASAGNHAQGVAYHAALLGIPATIVMPTTTPATKVQRTKVLDADVILEGTTFEAAEHHARLLADRDGLTLVHPFADPLVIAGQGTVALEMLADDPTLDTLVVPIGGGGLISGMAIAAKALKPGIRVIGVQSEVFAWAARHPVPAPVSTAPTVAEGIGVKQPHSITKALVERLVDDVVVVTEESIEEAVCLLLDIEKVVAEGAGAAAMAAILSHPECFAGQRCGAVLSGGNVDLRLLTNMMMRSLARSGRLVRLWITLNDLPGALADVLRLIADAGGNVVEVHHLRHQAALSSRRAEIEVEIEFNSGDALAPLVAALLTAGYAVERR